MSLDLEGFNKALMEWSRDFVPEQAVLVQKKIALDAFGGTILKTPVDTGRARMGWMMTVDSASKEVPAKGSGDKEGTATIATGVTNLGELGFGQIVWIANNVEYIGPLEHGTSGQAPNGMLGVTLQEIQSGL